MASKKIKGFLVIGKCGGFKGLFKERWKAERFKAQHSPDYKIVEANILIEPLNI